ncbi:TonB-dependent receptor [Opitutus sp. GAS368]|uniref:TonB-dependent receptor n=1 Tax=Opitutus sp. GAS368 TaxID=1882749 RepID=UPI00087C4AC1|nr:TonB-dependent receptor [Opitutus sp. GAS368]SDR86486.1 iron complex outermembrane recepter protein [Opitutus sp. GAS368]
MNKHPARSHSAAALLAALLLVSCVTRGLAQTTAAAKDDDKKTDVVQLDKLTVTTGYRSPKAIDQIPGAITLISPDEINNALLLSDDLTAVLARTVPGYAPATQQMQNTGETLRGRVALRLFDGISQTTPLREGSRNATFTDMDIVSQIEVINGPSAAEGIGAAGGIINYISKSPTKDGSEATLRTKFFGQGYSDSYGYRVGLNYTHKEGANDLIFGAAFEKRGAPYDANGRLQGLGASGSDSDTQSKNLFIKAGHSFGENNAQRLTLTVSQFRIEGMGHYVQLLGDRTQGITDSAIRGVPPGGRASFNDFSQYALAYKNDALFGGSLNVQAYKASQAMRFNPEVVAPDKADPVLAPLGVGIDQSEINSQKKGVRSSWSGKDVFGLTGLELTPGFDYMDETAQQLLALTGRTWVPPMNYTSKAPFAQASYTQGPVTVSGGVRHEGGTLQVDDYTTVYFAHNTFVKGGTLEYSSTLPNAGVIVRLPQNWSVFGSYSKGFSLPNVGIPLRNVNTPGQTVNGIVDLQAVIFDNKEGGVSWHGKQFSFSGSYYRSYSDLGSSLSVDPVTKDFILQRRPVLLRGLEFSGEYKMNAALKFTAIFSHTTGYTRTSDTGPLIRQQGMSNVSPDKLNLSSTWKFYPRASLTLDVEHLFSRDINIGAPGEEHTVGLTLAHLTATYSTKKWGDFSLGVENLLNHYYILPWAQIDQFQNYFAGRGRVISISHVVKF